MDTIKMSTVEDALKKRFEQLDPSQKEDVRKALEEEILGREYLSGDESRAEGKALRQQFGRKEQGEWTVRKDRKTSVERIFAQETSRIPELLPIRHERMAASPFAFYRGAAIVMADDLATLPRTGVTVQACGDAHISNFGMFNSPERNLIFDINDFDETLPGSWEWDLKRLLASVEICGRDRGFSSEARREAVMIGAASYREYIKTLSEMSTMDVWYSQLQVESLFHEYESYFEKKDARLIRKNIDKASAKNLDRALTKLTVEEDGKIRLISNPPLIIPIREMRNIGLNPDEAEEALKLVQLQYRLSLPRERRALIDQYRVVDIAAKVVGVGSVGTRCWIALMEGRQKGDYLVLQIKEAGPSVLAPYEKENLLMTNGQRVVEGQRAIQTVSDILLGWARIKTSDGKQIDYYIRQLWDGKGSVDLEKIRPEGFVGISKLCACVLAHAHARTGDRYAINGYLGNSSEFDEAMAQFAVSYADQTEIDYEQFKKMI